MKLFVIFSLILMSLSTFAESTCDVIPGNSVGVKVIEFVSGPGHTVHSKIPFKETTADTLLEEMINLQDMGVCEEKIVAKKCVLKFETIAKKNYVSLIRGDVKWSSWTIKAKPLAEKFVKNMKRVGFCS